MIRLLPFLLLASCTCARTEPPPVLATPAPTPTSAELPPSPPPTPPSPDSPPQPAPEPTPAEPAAAGPIVVGILGDTDRPDDCACTFERKGRHGVVIAYSLGRPEPEPAVIHLDGRVVRLDASEPRTEFHATEDLTFQRGDLRARVRVKLVHDAWEEAEALGYDGTLELTAPGRPTRTLDIEGVCGC